MDGGKGNNKTGKAARAENDKRSGKKDNNAGKTRKGGGKQRFT